MLLRIASIFRFLIWGRLGGVLLRTGFHISENTIIKVLILSEKLFLKPFPESLKFKKKTKNCF